MKRIFGGLLGILLLAACVPAKKYNDLLVKEQKCSEELTKFKTDALDYKASSSDYKAQFELLSTEVSALKTDTSAIGQKHRTLLAKYDRLVDINEALETTYGKLQLTGATETASLTADLDAKMLELQRKESELFKLESELEEKGAFLAEREQRVLELETLIRRKDEAAAALKKKVSDALAGFKNKGLTIEERNGKIYVSLEAKLLFGSGSTTIEAEGKGALIELAKVLESEKDLEVIVEGHTDTDKIKKTTHPTSNWELSVLRSTAVIEIMMANSTIDPKQLMAAGRSEFHPVDPANKAKNRRIEIIISPNLNELYELISK
ncbi:MAG: chemotaxis protein MotB [Flavobacteriales bacterium]|jgi:chemotaxis protein MotB